MSKTVIVRLDEIGENVRRARAICALALAQVAADSGDDLSADISLALCGVDDLLNDAQEETEAMGRRER
ncbi:MAG: hypothetical protein AB7U95_37835 [Reyranella sp.]